MLTIEDFKASLPLFFNHRSARAYLKNKYQERIMMKGTKVEGNIKIYLYHFITDKGTYIESLEKIKTNEPYSEHKYLHSFFNVEITENGKIKVYSNFEGKKKVKICSRIEANPAFL